MKIIIALVMTLSAAAAMASGPSVKETLRSIEMDRNVKCEFVSGSLAICIGSNQDTKVCRSTSTYECVGAESFVLKLKIKTSYNYDSNSRESVVTGVNFEH